MALAEEKLARTRILAPSTVLSCPEMIQMLGSLWRRERCCSRCPAQFLSLIVQVDERDVRHIAVGQSGTCRASQASLATPCRLTLSKITAGYGRRGRRNSFRVEARLPETASSCAGHGRRRQGSKPVSAR